MSFDTKLLADLMACKPVSSQPENVNRASAILNQKLTAAGLHCTMENCGDYQVLFASTTPGKEPDVLLNAHIDVVPATDDLFTLKIDGDIARGRGVGDCLGNAVSIAQILINLKNQASVGAIFSCDEEIGGATTAAMVKLGYRARRLAIVIDGPTHALAIAQKGIIIIRLRARGAGGHASAPWACDNPIEKLLDGYAKLKSAWPEVSADDQWHDTMAPCQIQAGFADNQIPEQAEMILNIRYTQEENFATITHLVENLTGLETEVLRTCKPLYTDENAPAIQALLAAMRQAFPDKDIAVRRMNGATDARHMGAFGVPVAIIGTPGGSVHSDQEWADLDGIDKYTNMLTDFIRDSTNLG